MNVDNECITKMTLILDPKVYSATCKNGDEGLQGFKNGKKS